MSERRVAGEIIGSLINSLAHRVAWTICGFQHLFRQCRQHGALQGLPVAPCRAKL